MRPSRGTEWPRDVSDAIHARDGVCVGPRIGLAGPCVGEVAKDHIRASGGMGMKSASTVENGALLCVAHHDFKTLHGREVRPLLLAYVQGRA